VIEEDARNIHQFEAYDDLVVSVALTRRHSPFEPSHLAILRLTVREPVDVGTRDDLRQAALQRTGNVLPMPRQDLGVRGLAFAPPGDR
jgi:hypothetical protein